MKAVIYGGDKTLEVVPGHLVAPEEGQVRLSVAYCGVCGTDVHIFHGHMDQRVARPQIIGHEVSAVVRELGEGVTNVSVGDKVAVRPLLLGEPTSFDRGFEHVGKNMKFIGIDRPGGMQSSWTVPAYTLHRLPEDMSLQHGALIEPAAVAVHDVRLGEVTSGETCVVIGGGPIGLLIALVAKNRGARVILAEIDDTRLALARSLGCEVINPQVADAAAAVESLTDGHMADIVFEVSGAAAGVELMTRLPAVRGRIVMVAIHAQPRTVDLFKFFWSEIKLIGARLYEARDFDEAITLVAAGRIPVEPLITAVHPMEDAPAIFADHEGSPAGVKNLVDCRAEP